MQPSRSILASSLALAFVVGATVARADVPPPDTCTTPGKACSTAPPDFKHPGTCQEQTCSRTVPEPDGALRDASYTCMRCVAGGAGGAGGNGGGGNGGGGKAGSGGTLDAGRTDAARDAGASTPIKSTGCNCVLAATAESRTPAALAMMAGLLGLLARRRSRRA